MPDPNDPFLPDKQLEDWPLPKIRDSLFEVVDKPWSEHAHVCTQPLIGLTLG